MEYTVQCTYAGYHTATVNVEGDTLKEALDSAILAANEMDSWDSIDHSGDTFVDAYVEGRVGVLAWDGRLPVPFEFTEAATVIGPQQTRRVAMSHSGSEMDLPVEVADRLIESADAAEIAPAPSP